VARQIPDVLTDDELARLLAVPSVTTASGLRNRAILELGACAGLRNKELVGLRTTDIRQENGDMVLHLSVTKGGVARRVPLPPEAASWLRLWLARRTELGIRSRTVFCTISTGRRMAGFTVDPELKPGEPLDPRYLRQMVSQCARKAGVERRVNVHTLRHSYATRLLRHCHNVRVVQTALGHKSVTTTQVYLHVLNEELSDAVRTLPAPEAVR